MENLELITLDGNKIELAKETTKQIKKLMLAKMQLDKIEEQLKAEMMAVMENTGITSWENEVMKVSYKATYTRKSVDTQRLKDDGLYDNYLKETQVKPSVSVSFK